MIPKIEKNRIKVNVGGVGIDLPEEDWAYPICMQFLATMRKEFLEARK